MRFCAEQRLRRQSDFQHVRAQGRRFDCGAFTIWYAPHATKEGYPTPVIARLGVVASRSAVGNSPQRNRAKRRLREVFRNHQNLVPGHVDILLIARGSLNRLEYLEIERKFVDACRKIFPSKPTHV